MQDPGSVRSQRLHARACKNRYIDMFSKTRNPVSCLHEVSAAADVFRSLLVSEDFRDRSVLLLTAFRVFSEQDEARNSQFSRVSSHFCFAFASCASSPWFLCVALVSLDAQACDAMTQVRLLEIDLIESSSLRPRDNLSCG